MVGWMDGWTDGWLDGWVVLHSSLDLNIPWKSVHIFPKPVYKSSQQHCIVMIYNEYGQKFVNN